MTDDYFGTKITDNYRWLEDAKSPETRAFIDAQNAYTARYLKQARIRPQVVDDLDALWKTSPRPARPSSAANNYFFRSGWPASSSSRSMCATAGQGKDERLHRSGQTEPRPQHFGLHDGCLPRWNAAWLMAIRSGGADETSIHLLNVKTGKTLEDELPTARYFGVSFAPDGASLYYARNNKQGTLLYQHVLGTRRLRGQADLRPRVSR